jgi:hypothetical protein
MASDSVGSVRPPGHSAIAGAVMALALVACTSSASHTAPASRSAPPGPVVSAVGMPGCSTATRGARQLPAGLVRLSPVPGAPFGVAVTADGRWSFVSLQSASQSQGGVGVLAW